MVDAVYDLLVVGFYLITFEYFTRFFFCSRDLHKVLHSFPTRRSSDLCFIVRTWHISLFPPSHQSLPTNSPALIASRTLSASDSDRKSTRLNSSHQISSYAVFCLKKKTPPNLPGGHLPGQLGDGGCRLRLARGRVLPHHIRVLHAIFFLLTRLAQSSTLFPYTTLFRSLFHRSDLAYFSISTFPSVLAD